MFLKHLIVELPDMLKKRKKKKEAFNPMEPVFRYRVGYYDLRNEMHQHWGTLFWISQLPRLDYFFILTPPISFNGENIC